MRLMAAEHAIVAVLHMKIVRPLMGLFAALMKPNPALLEAVMVKKAANLTGAGENASNQILIASQYSAQPILNAKAMKNANPGAAFR